MKNSKTIFRDLVEKIQLDESKEEIQSIVYTLLEHFLKLSKTDVIAERTVEYESKAEILESAIKRINCHEPLQYVIGQADFFGRTFKVNPAVLIPRPETEETIRIVKAHLKNVLNSAVTILDIGTGSGCIPITLALELANIEVYATDISEKALEVAKQNATLLNAGKVHFRQHDILHEEIPFHCLECIISNPPYITQKEQHTMKQNVLDFEPHLALFVPNEKPLLFYEAITVKGIAALNTGGLLVFEINEQYGKEVAALLGNAGFKGIQIISDSNGKERVVKGIKT